MLCSNTNTKLNFSSDQEAYVCLVVFDILIGKRIEPLVLWYCGFYGILKMFLRILHILRFPFVILYGETAMIPKIAQKLSYLINIYFTFGIFNAIIGK